MKKHGNFLKSEYKFLKIKIWKLLFFFKITSAENL